MKASTSNIQRSTFNAQRSTPRISKFRAHKREDGIALVITLGVLTVILLIAVAFALSARTEARSGSSYDMLVTSKSMAKMGLDRCVMEGSRLSVSKPFSGGNTAIYTNNDLTQYDGSWMTDSNPVHAIEGDYVDINENGERDSTEPYWIAVRDDNGKIVGRFAYTIVGDPTAGTNAASNVLDINGIGSYTNVGGFDTYVRGQGFIGDTNGGYTIGVAGDVNLGAFLEKLGYNDPYESARKILAFRYGYDGGTNTPPHGSFYPGVDNGDDNLIWGMNDHAEYNPSAPLDNDDRVKDINEVLTLIDPDPAHSNLLLYAIDGSSAGDDNKKSYYAGNRINLNNTNISPVADVDNILNNVLLKAYPAGDLDQLTQWAVNIVDFHTTNQYPTVYTNAGGTIFIGIKRTPYFNQIRNKHVIKMVQSGANYQLNLSASGANFPAELWNPYAVSFPYGVTVIVTNQVYLSCVPSIPQLEASPVVFVRTNTFTGPIAPGFTGNGFPMVLNDYSALFPTSSLAGNTIYISNRFTFVTYVTGNPSAILGIGSGETSSTNTVLTTNMSFTTFMNAEADDPRIGYLFPQPRDTGSGYYSLVGGTTGGTNVYTWSDQGGPNGLTAIPSTTNREGLVSFSTNYIGKSYASIADIGLVYRGEPLRGSNAVGAWQTLSLGPGGVGAVLEYVRVNDLSGVRGRININADTNGVGGAPLQSPALWALFDGINPGYGALSSNKIETIIAELGAYRASMPPTVLNGATNIVFTNIGQICELASLSTDNSGNPIPSTNDAAREYIIRSIASLITVSPDSAQELMAWGQSFRGNVPSGIIQIRAGVEGGSGSQIKLRKFRYVQH